MLANPTDCCVCTLLCTRPATAAAGSCARAHAKGLALGLFALALALLAALSLTALALLSTPHVAPTLPPATLFPLLAGLMALSGIGTIGFIGLALSRAVELADGVPEAPRKITISRH